MTRSPIVALCFAAAAPRLQVLFLTRGIVAEKETKLREGMRMMVSLDNAHFINDNSHSSHTLRGAGSWERFAVRVLGDLLFVLGDRFSIAVDPHWLHQHLDSIRLWVHICILFLFWAFGHWLLLPDFCLLLQIPPSISSWRGPLVRSIFPINGRKR